MMPPDSKLPTEAQRRKLCELMSGAFLELRMLCWAGKAEQAADLADAFHSLPSGMWCDGFSLQFFRDAFLRTYQDKYPEARMRDYVAMVDEIAAMEE